MEGKAICGLVGVIGTGINNGDTKAFQQLLYADVLRGKHSTGVTSVDMQDKVNVAKRAVCAQDFLDMPRMTANIDVTKWALLGHNRHATQGASGSHANAHPFEHGTITLMHNGTLYNREGLLDCASFAVDSENICNTFSRKHYLDVLPKLDGAFALVWHDAADGNIRVVRNEERPLAFAVNKHRKVMYYASEMDMLKWILGRNDIQAEYITMKPGVVWTIDKDMNIETENVKLLDPMPKNGWFLGGGRSVAPSKSTTPKKIGGAEEELKSFGYDVHDEVLFEVEHCINSSARMPTFTYKGVMAMIPSVKVHAYAQDRTADYDYYSGTISNAYYDQNKNLCLTVRSCVPMTDDAAYKAMYVEEYGGSGAANKTSDCSMCGHPVGSNEESLEIDDWGIMHKDCYSDLMRFLNSEDDGVIYA